MILPDYVNLHVHNLVSFALSLPLPRSRSAALDAARRDLQPLIFRLRKEINKGYIKKVNVITAQTTFSASSP